MSEIEFQQAAHALICTFAVVMPVVGAAIAVLWKCKEENPTHRP